MNIFGNIMLKLNLTLNLYVVNSYKYIWNGHLKNFTYIYRRIHIRRSCDQLTKSIVLDIHRWTQMHHCIRSSIFDTSE